MFSSPKQQYQQYVVGIAETIGFDIELLLYFKQQLFFIVVVQCVVN